jgi:PIN domain
VGLHVEEDIHLLFPIVVVDELDRLKESSGSARWRAGHTLGRLDEAITARTYGTPHRGRPGEGRSMIGEVTVEIVLDQPGHTRLPIADDEIIERAVTIQAIAAREVRLLTCDTGQATRGRTAGLKVAQLPSNAGVGDEPPRHGNGGDQPRGNGPRAQRKNRREAELRISGPRPGRPGGPQDRRVYPLIQADRPPGPEFVGIARNSVHANDVSFHEEAVRGRGRLRLAWCVPSAFTAVRPGRCGGR